MGLGLVAGTPSGAPRPDTAVDEARRVLDRMPVAYDEVQDYTAHLVKTERLRDRSMTQTLRFRFRKPRSVYVKVTDGFNKGRTAVFPSGENDDRVKVENAFLWIDTTLDPRDPRLMENQHHPLTDAGLGYAISVVMRSLERAERRNDRLAHYRGTEVLDGRTTHRVVLDAPPACEGEPYTVKDGDTLWSIAKAAGQDMYVILHRNPSVRKPDRLESGRQIEIPPYYARRTELWIDTSLELPLKLEMFDCEGQLYESYYYRDLRIDVGLTDEDIRFD